MMRKYYIGLCLILCGFTACSSRELREAQAVVATADSLRAEGRMYGIDEGDSASLAQAYETLKKYSVFYSFIQYTSSLDTYAHACYHYGRLLRQKENPVEAMQCFINATHTCTLDYHILGRIYSNMGSIAHLAGDFPLSYKMYEHSADVFLKSGDTTAYYYALNDMAYEMAEQAEVDRCFSIIQNIKNNYRSDSTLLAYCCISKGEAMIRSSCFNSALEYAYQSKLYASNISAADLQLAQAYFSLENKDSSVYYANRVVMESNKLFEINNALYILTNNDETMDKTAIRQTAADRSDTQKLLEIRCGKMSQAVQLLELDLARKPNLAWLYAIVATLVIISIGIGAYVSVKRKQHGLISQKVEDLTSSYVDMQSAKITQIEQNCKLFQSPQNLNEDFCWRDFEKMCKIADGLFYLITSKLKKTKLLNEQEIRLCILVLLDYSRIQIADVLPYAQNGIGKFKYRVAKKMGTEGKNLRKYLIRMAIDDTLSPL